MTHRILRTVGIGTKEMERLPHVQHQRYLDTDSFQGDITLQFLIHHTDSFETVTSQKFKLFSVHATTAPTCTTANSNNISQIY